LPKPADRSFAGFGFLGRLHSLPVAMNQKSFVVQIPNSVPLVLTSEKALPEDLAIKEMLRDYAVMREQARGCNFL
jgi:hypothetical protein